MQKKVSTKEECTCGTGVPCCVEEVAIQGKCTCGTGVPCCIHEVKVSQGKTKTSQICGPECTTSTGTC